MTTLHLADTGETLEVDVQELIIAGWAGHAVWHFAGHRRCAPLRGFSRGS